MFVVDYFGTDGYFGCQICFQKFKFSYHSNKKPCSICPCLRHTSYGVVLGAPYFDDRSRNLRTTTAGPRSFSSQKIAPGADRRALGRIRNIQNKLLKALYGKGSPKSSATGGDALTGV